MIPTPRGNTVDMLHGVAVPDPYRWLEAVDAPEVLAWAEAQTGHLRALVDGPSSTRPAIRARLEQLWNFERIGVPYRKAGRLFFRKNDGLQNQAVLYQQADGAEPAVVLDPNSLSTDGTVALMGTALSEDARLMAYATSASGSDWQQINVRTVDGAFVWPQSIPWVRFTNIAWRKDGSGFYYSRFPNPRTVAPGRDSFDCTVRFHRVGADPATDPVVLSRPDMPQLAFDPEVSEDGAFLVLTVWDGTDPKNRLYYREEPAGPIVRLVDEMEAAYRYIGNVGRTFFVQTDLDAPKGRVVAIDLDSPERAAWRTVVPESDETLEQCVLIGGRLVLLLLRDACHRVAIHQLDGADERDLELPGIGSISGLSGRADSPEIFYGFTSFLTPGTVYRHDLDTRETTLFHTSQTAFDSAAYATEQIWATSKDGTRIPMFLTRRRDAPRDGSGRALLYGYGGFNISLSPSYSTGVAQWLESGGVYAVANLRGGGEYGEGWHQAGILDRKQNVFDDFIACAEKLIADGVTAPGRLAIEGGSNGGLLVAATMLQRPELFGAVVCHVPVADMLRYHRWTVGRYWTGEYGNADESAEHLRFQLAYSPVHNCRPAAYPPTLILTADHDDRVYPANAYKFAAALQHAQRGQAPILLRVELKAGHGAGKPTTKAIDEAADVRAFLDMALRG